MQNYETGEQYPCPRCGRDDCNGMCRPNISVKEKNPETESKVSELLAKAAQLRAAKVVSADVTENSGTSANEGAIPSRSTMEMFREYGRQGGKIGGAIGGRARAQKLSPERRSEIARLAGLRKGK